MPRQKKADSEVLKRRSITFTDAEWIAIGEVAKERQLTVCQLVREMLRPVIKQKAN